MKPNIQFENHGSIILIRPMDDEARKWIEENVAFEPWQWFGGGLVCEPRMAANLANDLERS